MDVNSSEWSRREFCNLAAFCENLNGNMCDKTKYACKDYLCPIVEKATNIKEVRTKFAQQTAERSKPLFNPQGSSCQHKWEYSMFHNICTKCGLVDDA
jgi:hypothetical protein